MQKKLTITVDSKVYEGLHAVIGRGNISRFLEDLARPYILKNLPHPSEAELEKEYSAMAVDENREAEAHEWIESNISDGLGEFNDEAW